MTGLRPAPRRLLAGPILAAAAFIIGCRGDAIEPTPPPAAPGHLVAVAVAWDRIELEWAYAGAGADGFRIEQRGPGQASFQVVGEVPVGQQAFTVSDLSAESSYDHRVRACAGEACSEPSNVASAATFPAGVARSHADRPDDLDGPQVHVMYVVPQDGPDRQLDLDGTLARSVASFHAWFQQRTGLRLRLDTREGSLDITFRRLVRAEADLTALGPFVVTAIEAELDSLGLLRQDKVYLVYYDGGSTYSCGGAAWPPHVPGRVAALYLRGTPPGASCAAQSFVESASSFPRYWEFAALHDLIHILGIVAANAPDHADAYPAHLPHPTDLMYGGPDPWVIDHRTVVDAAGTNYLGEDVPDGVPSLGSSPYVDRPPVTAALGVPGLEPLTSLEAAELAEALATLPFHPPFPRTVQP